MRWGADMEERAAVVKKAHDAYATASASREEAKGATARVDALAAELDEMRADLAGMHRTVTALKLRIDELERARAPKLPRKVAA